MGKNDGTLYDMENSKKRIDYRYLMTNKNIDSSLRAQLWTSSGGMENLQLDMGME